MNVRLSFYVTLIAGIGLLLGSALEAVEAIQPDGPELPRRTKRRWAPRRLVLIEWDGWMCSVVAEDKGSNP